MTYDVFLSTASVAAILVGVALLAILITLALGASSEPDGEVADVLFFWLATVWATAVLVIALIKYVI